MKKLVVLALSIFAAVTVSNAQVCALKSNVLPLINGTVNMAAEFSFAPQWTIDLSGTAVVKISLIARQTSMVGTLLVRFVTTSAKLSMVTTSVLMHRLTVLVGVLLLSSVSTVCTTM